MYRVAVRRDFTAQHYLIGGDWGAENDWHSHHYQVEVCLEGVELDQHNYLVDIVEIETELEDQIAHYRDRTLNELPEFQGQNPSVELFSSLFARALSDRISAPNVSSITVTLWENQIAWASYQLDRS